MSGYYTPTAEENMAGSQAVISDPDMNNSGHQRVTSASADQSATDVHDSEASCSTCETSASSSDPSGNSGDASSGTDTGIDVIPGLSSLPILADIVPDLGGSDGELLAPVTSLVATVCSGNLDALAPGLGVGDLGRTVDACLDKVTEPAGNLGGAVVNEAGSVLHTVGDTAGLPHTTQALSCIIDSLGIGNIGTSGGGLVADIVNLPQDILSGGSITGSIGGILDSAANTVNELPGLVPSLLDDLGSPLISGNLGSDGQAPGSHLIEADVGQQQSNGLILDLLAQPDNGPHHAVEANVGNGPNLIDANLLNGGDALGIPALNGIGLDSLTGLLGETALPDLGGSTGAAPLAIVDDVMATLDIGGLLDIGSIQTASNNNGSLLHGLL